MYYVLGKIVTTQQWFVVNLWDHVFCQSSVCLSFNRLCLSSLQLVEELVGKWQSFPEGQQTPLCAHLLGLAMKAITPLALGERFRDDAEVIRFRKNHDAVSEPHTHTLTHTHKHAHLFSQQIGRAHV